MFTTSISILERVRQPADEHAWQRFIQLYTPLLMHWTRGWGLQESDAADVVQEVFLILLKEMPAFRHDPAKRFRGWLWTVTRNAWRRWLRRDNQHLADDVEVEGCALSQENGAGEEAEYQQLLMGRRLQLIQVDFQPATWKAFWESAIVGRPVSEVAAELGLQVDTVYVYRRRVLQRLRQEFGDLLE